MTSLSYPCCSDSNPDLVSNPDLLVDYFFWVEMVKTTSTFSPAVTQLVVPDPPTRGVLSTPNDFWIDTEYYFVPYQ